MSSARHPALLKVLLPLIVLVAVVAGVFAEVRQAHAAVQATFYVSPSGSDSNAGTLAAPFQTLAKAQSVVRAINSNMTGDIYVYLRGGTYPISSTVAFSPQDSGTNGYTMYYQAYPGETPILSAGTSVTGWTQYSGSIYQAHLSRTTTLRSLYVNDHRAVMDSKTITSQGCYGTYTVTAGQASWAWVSGSQADGVQYNQADLPTIATNQNDVEISNSTTWNQNFVSVRSIITSGSHWVLQLQQPYGAIAQQVGYGAGFSCASGTTTTVWNAFALLNTPGQFYFDKSTQTLYYDKLSNENMSTATVIAPTGLTTLLTIAGTSTTNRVQNLTFSGLTFAYTDWNMENIAGTTGKATVQGSTVSLAFAQGNWHNDVYRSIDTLPAAVMVDNSQNIRFVQNTFKHTGADGLAYRNDVVNSQIIGNYIADIGGSALTLDYPQHVYIGDGGTHEKFPPGVEGVVGNTLVKDNFISNTATLFAGSSAVAAFFVNGLDFEHNVLQQTPWNGLSLGWGWHNFNGASDSVFPGNPTTTAGNTTVNDNAFFNTMQTLGDSGPIYTLGAQPNTTMNGNYMQGIQGGYGFHLDEGSAYISVSNTVEDIGTHYTYNAENFGEKHDLQISATYSTNASVYGGTVPPNSTYAPIMVYTPTTWPAAALSIIHNAGLEPANQTLIPGPVYLASAATLGGGACQVADHTGYSGSSFVACFSAQGASAALSVYVSDVGSYVVPLRYSNGPYPATETKTISVYVNGTKIQQISLPATADWNTWNTVSTTLPLAAGANTITYKVDAGDIGWVNLDSLRVLPFLYEAEVATLSGGACVATDHTDYTGTGFVACFGSQGAKVSFAVTITSGGGHIVTLRYSNGPYPANETKTMSVYVNGTKVQQISLPSTPDWESWSSVTTSLTLNAGANTIAYQVDSGDTGWVNLDDLAVA